MLSPTARLSAHLSIHRAIPRTAPDGAAPPDGAARGAGADRGDVPGWVLVTVMSAGIVVAIAGVAAPTLQGMFEQAIAAVQVP